MPSLRCTFGFARNASHLRDGSIHQLFIDRPFYRQEPVLPAPQAIDSQLQGSSRGHDGRN
jgi:hypothetical protein